MMNDDHQRSIIIINIIFLFKDNIYIFQMFSRILRIGSDASIRKYIFYFYSNSTKKELLVRLSDKSRPRPLKEECIWWFMDCAGTTIWYPRYYEVEYTDEDLEELEELDEEELEALEEELKERENELIKYLEEKIEKELFEAERNLEQELYNAYKAFSATYIEYEIKK